MKKFMELHGKAQPWLNLLGRLVLGIVLLLAGYLKAKAPAEAAMSVRAYEVLPIPVANILGYSLPWLEIGVGLLLIIGLAVKKSSILGGGLMFLFIVAIAQAWARGLSIDCGCFGSGGQVEPGQTKYLQEILRDAGLTAIAIYLFRYPHGKLALDKRPEIRA
jgi:uncharacterized membrane protein YphA (DoxX/SURF4 family)